MAIRVYRVAVIGCPRSVIAEDGSFKGVGKSCLCNRFVRPEAYSEAHDSVLSVEDWTEKPVFNGDHFIYWGAATKHLRDGSKARFQIVEHTECYELSEEKLRAHPARVDYFNRATDVRVASSSAGKIAYRLHAEQVHAARNFGPIRATQLFPNEDFNSKTGPGIYGYVCVFDPTLEGDQMKRQLDFLSEILHAVCKRKRKVAIACVKCDVVEETKIRYGSNLANYATKKPIPFFEVSSREGVNVQALFHSLISSPKKRKPTKNGKHSSGAYASYKEVVSLRKNDLNRARDEYRKLLQKKVTDFACVWSEVFPTLEQDPEFSLVLQLGGKEGKDIVKKMFCLRLIELKLMEASKEFGSSSRKKVKKEKASAFQEYLSEAFRKHPDLGTESLYDYVYSPSSSADGLFGLTKDRHDSDVTEPSTPIAYTDSQAGTPDLSRPFSSYSLQAHGSTSPFLPPRPRSAIDGSYSKSYQATENGDSSDSYERSTLPKASKKKSHSNDDLEDRAPPLPSREELCPASAQLQKSVTTQSQPFLDKDEKPGALKRKGEANRLSNSMEVLLLPGEESAEKAKGGVEDPEPYMDPIYLKKLQTLGPLPPLPVLPPFRESHASQFMSMRVSSRSQRPALPKLQTIDSPDSSSSKRSESMQSRGHRRTRSNPWVLDTRLSSDTPPPTPPLVSSRDPKKKKIPPPVPPRVRVTPKHTASKNPPTDNDIVSPIESSLDFAQAGESGFHRAKVVVVRPWIVPRSTKIDDDARSDISGPFEEIDEDERLADVYSRPRASSERAITPSNVSSVARNSGVAIDDDDEDLNNQYAKIEEFQYMPMAPAAAVRLSPNHSGTYPPLHSPPHELEQLSRSRQAKSFSFSHVLLGTTEHSRRHTNSSVPLSSPWNQDGAAIPASATDSPDASPQSSRKGTPRKSPLPEFRPLPPSPTKAFKGLPLRKISSGAGSNIYEVIDEEFVAKVKNRKQHGARSQEAQRVWTPPVDPQHLDKYLEIVQKFFSIPEVYRQWVSTVESVLPAEDPNSFPPPLYRHLIKKEEEREEEEEEEEEAQKEGGESRSSNKPTIIPQSPKPRLQGSKNDDEIPIVFSRPSPLLSTTPQMQHKPPSPGSPIPSPLITTHAASSPHSIKKANSRDDLIEMMNQQLNQGVSSDSETDDSDSDNESEDTDTDSDHSDHDDQSDPEDCFDPDNHSDQDQYDSESVPSLHHQHNGHSIQGNHGRFQISIVQTDLDLATSALRNSVSTDSDLASEAVKYPCSNSREDVDKTSDGGEATRSGEYYQGGVATLVPRKSLSRRKADTSNDRNLSMSDSGISNCHSQTFEDGFSVQNFESDC